jgi:S1-C subfamily serine protease
MEVEPVKRTIITLLAILELCVAFPLWAQNAEEIFKDARAYTVQVRTSVPVPFIDDERGNFKGAGFVVDVKRGWIMTNRHVVGGSPSHVEVAFDDDKYSDATKLYVDPFLDLAILEIDKDQLDSHRAAQLECESIPSVGHAVGAFGHPWGLPYTGTRGIVSGRTDKLDGEMIQTDAPINAGNSGGPLISLETGHVVGINTMGMSGPDAESTNFALMMFHACRVLELLQAGLDPSPPLPGLVFMGEMGVSKKLLVAANHLHEGDIDLRVGDQIIGLAGSGDILANKGQFVHAVRGKLDDLTLRVLRNGEEIVVRGSMQPLPHVLDQQGIYVSGMLLAPIFYVDRGDFGKRPDVSIQYLESGSTARAMDLELFDSLMSMDGEPVTDLMDIYDRLEAAWLEERPVRFVFKRLDWEDHHIFGYVQREFDIWDLELLGPVPVRELEQVARIPRPNERSEYE